MEVGAAVERYPDDVRRCKGTQRTVKQRVAFAINLMNQIRIRIERCNQRVDIAAEYFLKCGILRLRDGAMTMIPFLFEHTGN